MKMNRRTAGALALALSTLWTFSAAAAAENLEGAAESVRQAFPLALLRFERGNFFSDSALSPAAALVLHTTPLLLARQDAVMEAWSSELQQLPDPDTEEHEGTVLTQPDALKPEMPSVVRDNGVPAATLRASDPSGYLIYENVYVNNASAAALDVSDLGFDCSAVLTADAPQVLIVHTHGCEAYTMPEGEEYEASDDHRTLDETKNVLRVGDEIARVLTEAGIGVLHDRTLHDYPSYSGAYNRSLATVERYMEQYPSIVYVFDVHRDAVAAADGSQYKLICDEEPNAAQLEFVVGSDGGGLSHDRWRENLKLACAIQSAVLDEYPTLMRPIIVRNSRYNQQVSTGSLLIEVGAAGNSLDEAINAARLFASGFVRAVSR